MDTPRGQDPGDRRGLRLARAGRPEQAGIFPLEARRELARRAGGNLDQRVVRAPLRVLDEGDERYASATDDRFGFPSGVEVRGPVDTGDRTLRAADGLGTR